MALAIRLGNRSPNHAMWPKCQTQNETETGGNKKKGRTENGPDNNTSSSGGGFASDAKGLVICSYRF